MSPATTTPPACAFPRNRYGLDYVSDSEQSNLSEGSDTDGNGSSDCEMLGDTGTARKGWETAASIRAMPHDPLKPKDVRASTSASSAESTTHHDANFENLFASECPLDDDIAEPPALAFPRNRYALDYVSDSEQSNLSEGSDTDANGSSDCEMLGDTGTARKGWETAASIRAMPHDPLKCKDVRASTSASSAESTTHHDANFENLFASECPLDDDIAEYFRCAFNQVGPSSTNGAKHGTGPSSARNVQECPMDHDSNGRTCSLNPDAAGNDEATNSRNDPVPGKGPETSTHHDANFENLFASECHLDDDIAEYFRCAFNQAGPSSTNGAKHGTGPFSARNVQECPMDHDCNGRTCSLNPDTRCLRGM